MISAFDFEKDYVLEDRCVLLRPLSESDCDNLLEFSLNEPETWKYGVVTAAGADNLKFYIHHALHERNNKREYAFIVFDKRTNEYAGSTRFYDIQLAKQTLQLGYTWYGSRFRGNGLNAHCKFLLLSFAFEKMNMLRVEFRADNTNYRSIAAMKKIGCIVEGELRKDVPKADGTRRTSIILSILKEEWENGVKENLKKQISHLK